MEAGRSPSGQTVKQRLTVPSHTDADDSTDGIDCSNQIAGQEMLTVTPLDRQMWESLLAKDPWRGYTKNRNNQATTTTEEDIPTSASSGQVTAESMQRNTVDTRNDTSHSAASDTGTTKNEFDEARMQFSSIRFTRPAASAVSDAIRFSQSRTLTSPSATSRTIRVVNWASEFHDSWGQTPGKERPSDVSCPPVLPPTGAEAQESQPAGFSAIKSAKAPPSGVNSRRPPPRLRSIGAGGLQPAIDFRRAREMSISGVEVVLSSIADSTDEVDRMLNVSATKVATDRQSGFHFFPEGNADSLYSDTVTCCQSRNKASSTVKGFPGYTIIDTEQETLRSSDDPQAAAILPRLEKSKRRYSVAHRAHRRMEAPRQQASQKFHASHQLLDNFLTHQNDNPWAFKCPRKSAGSGPVSSEVTMEFSGDSSGEAELLTPATSRPQSRSGDVNSAGRRSIPRVTRDSSASEMAIGADQVTKQHLATLTTNLPTVGAAAIHTVHHSPIRIMPLEYARALGSCHSASSDWISSSQGADAVTVANFMGATKNSNACGMVRLRSQLHTTLGTSGSVVKSTNTSTSSDERPMRSQRPSEAQSSAPHPSGIHNPVGESNNSLQARRSKFIRIGTHEVNEATQLDDGSIFRCIQPMSPQQYCVSRYEIFGVHGASEPKEVPCVAAKATKRKANDSRTTGSSQINLQDGDMWHFSISASAGQAEAGEPQSDTEPDSSGFEWISVTGAPTDAGQSSSCKPLRAACRHKMPLCKPRAAQNFQQPRLHTVRMYLRYKIGKVVLAGSVSDGPLHLPSIASLRSCTADHGRFVWLARPPARCSRAYCQILPGLLDSSQIRERSLVLHRSLVTEHICPTRRMALSSVALRVASSVRISALQVMAALRYIAPDESDLSCPESLQQFAAQSTDGAGGAPSIGHLPSTIEWRSDICHTTSFPPQAAPLRSTDSPEQQQRPSTFVEAHGSDCQSHSAAGSGSRLRQQRELRRIVQMKMRRKVKENEFVSVACCSQSTSDVEDSSQQQQQQTAGLEQQLGGLLDSWRSCRQTAAAAVSFSGNGLHQQSLEERSGLVGYVERMLHETFSQQAALNSLLATLKGDGVGDCEGSKGRSSSRASSNALEVGELASCKSAPNTMASSGSPQSEQFYSPTSGPVPDAGTRASRSIVGPFDSPSADPESCPRRRHYHLSMNNNADAMLSGSSGSGSQAAVPSVRPRHCTYYTRRCVVRMEDSAALLIQEVPCRTSSVVTACSICQDDVGENSSCSASSSSVQTSSVAAHQRRQKRLLVVELRTLAAAWPKLQLPASLMNTLGGTVGSFIWWNLIPLGRRLRLEAPPKSAAVLPPRELLDDERSVSSTVLSDDEPTSVTIDRLMTITVPAAW